MKDLTTLVLSIQLTSIIMVGLIILVYSNL